LVRVLEDWCQPVPGYHLYYPGTRRLSPIFALLVDAIGDEIQMPPVNWDDNLILQTWETVRHPSSRRPPEA
jgi:hypothetical protein